LKEKTIISEMLHEAIQSQTNKEIKENTVNQIEWAEKTAHVLANYLKS